MIKIKSVAAIILILAKGCSAEWEIPEELRVMDWIFDLSKAFAPLAGYSHFSTDARDEIVSVAQSLLDTHFQTFRSFVSRCSFPYSHRRRCLMNSKSIQEKSRSLLLEGWRSKLKNHNESCFIDGREQNCSSATAGDLIVHTISYNASHVTYALERKSQEQFYQVITKSTMDQRLINFFPTYTTTDFSTRASVADEIHVYGRDICMKNKCFNAIKQLASNLHEICVFDRCTSIMLDIATNDNFFQVELKLSGNGYEKPADSQLTTTLRGSKVPGFLSLLMIKAKVGVNDKSLPRFYDRRGRFHCPSETACPLEIAFQVDDSERNYDDFFNVFLFVIVYGLSRASLPIIS